MKKNILHKTPFLCTSLLLLIIFFSCNHQPASKKISKLHQFTPPGIKLVSNVSKPSADEIYVESVNDLKDPHTFNACKLYLTADTNAKVVSLLPAMTPLNILARIEKSGADTIKATKSQRAHLRPWQTVFYEVKTAEQEVYIKEDDVAGYVLKDSVNQAQYYLGRYYSKTEEKEKFRIYKFNLNSNETINHLIIDDLPETTLRVFMIKDTPLKDVKRLIKIVSSGEYCGGSETGLLIADTNDKLTALPENYTAFDDGGGVFNKIVYLATPDSSGKLILRTDTTGQIQGSQDTIAYPNQLNIPINELIVETTEEGQYFMDDNNEEVKLKNGKYKMETPLTLTTQYYHWDGKTVTKLPDKKVVPVKD